MLRSLLFFFFSSRRRHTRSLRDWSSDVCSSDLGTTAPTSSPSPIRAKRGSTSSPPIARAGSPSGRRSEEHTSELQSRRDLVCRLLLEKKKKKPLPLPSVKKKKKIIK